MVDDLNIRESIQMRSGVLRRPCTWRDRIASSGIAFDAGPSRRKGGFEVA